MREIKQVPPSSRDASNLEAIAGEGGNAWLAFTIRAGLAGCCTPGAAEVGGLCGDLLQTAVASDDDIYGNRCMSLVLRSVFLVLGYTYAVR